MRQKEKGLVFICGRCHRSIFTGKAMMGRGASFQKEDGKEICIMDPEGQGGESKESHIQECSATIHWLAQSHGVGIYTDLHPIWWG